MINKETSNLNLENNRLNKEHKVEAKNMMIIVNELYNAFRIFNRELFGNVLIEPVITVQSKSNLKLTFGWCSVNKVWVSTKNSKDRNYELNIVAEALFMDFYEIMTTLLHEMVHLYNLQHDIKDVSRGYTYHNKKFKEKAEEIGLLCNYSEQIGWSLCILSAELRDKIDTFNISKDAFCLTKVDKRLVLNYLKRKKAVKSKHDDETNNIEDTEGILQEPDLEVVEKKKSSYIRYVCKCNPPKIFRATRKLENVFCEDCNEYFYEE